MEGCLHIGFDINEQGKDLSALTVLKRDGENSIMIKGEVGEQAVLIYRLLTNQSVKIKELKEET
jgi:hypothetical protein